MIKKNLKEWEECLPHVEFAYNRAVHSTTELCPFEVVYGFKPITPLDLLPLPIHERVNMEASKRADFVKKIHVKTKELIEKKGKSNAARKNKKRKEMLFKPGDLVWVHFRKDRFPTLRKSKLKPRGAGPYKVLAKINDNAYSIDLPEDEFGVSNSFNVADLTPYQEETSIARGGEEQLDVKMDVKLDKELDMKISHGRAREEREECARGEEEVQAGPASGQTGPHAGLPGYSTRLTGPLTGQPGPWNQSRDFVGVIQVIYTISSIPSAAIIHCVHHHRRLLRRSGSSIAMLVLMNVRNKNKLFTKIVIKRLAMPTMGMTTNPKTTSSTTWTRHLIVKPMWMLKTKVIKIHQGVISGIILAMTKGAEDNLNMIKMREPTLDNVNNLDKIRNNILNMSQVKLVFNSNANPMLWLVVEDLLYHLKSQEMKASGEDDAEAYLSWALKVDKIFRIHNYSGAKKVAMASLEFEDYANTWWEQVVTLREEKGDPPIDTWEDMKEEMEARFVPKHYKTDLFNKLQKLKQGTKTVEEFFKEMELTMMRANIQESENQTIARFFNGLNYPIKRIVEFQQYSNMVELVHQASKAERQVNEDIKYSKSKQYFASKLATSTPTTSVKPTASSTPSKQPSIQSRMKQTVSSTASSKASTGPSNVTCFKCGTQGHKSFECKNTKVMITMENGDIETLSEGEYEALVQAAVANEEDYDEESGEDPLLCTHDPSPSLVVTRVLTTQPQAMEDQRCNIFQTRAGIGGKSIKVIIDGGSCHNLASTELCEKLNLTLRKHPHPYHVQWLSDKGNVKIQHTVTVNFKIGPYEDTVECDVVPMTVCHMLLGRPWQFDKKAIHDGFSNAYTFKVKDKKFELRPMTPSQIIADNAKALARAQHHIHHSELRGEGATHQKESERHHPHMSERKSVLLATKSEWREVKDNPSTTIHYVLICKGLSAETNDLTNIPSSLLSLLKEFQDVFPDELPHGLPPLRGIEHRIDLIPGAPLPNRAAYRTNPEDTKEIQRQIQDLLAKGEVVRLHGIPASIVSDRDVKFMSYLWKSLMAKFGVKLLFSSSSHPQTDGQTEVVNRSLSTLLRTLVKKNLKSWEDCLPHAEFAYNRAKHSTTLRSPFMIVYGFEPPTALDILPLPLHQRTNMDFDERTTAMKKLHEETRATIQDHVLRQATRLNAKKKERVFEEGDLVWVHLRKERFPQERNSKLKPRGDGPFKVLKRINNNAYVIDIPTSKYLVSNTFNISDLSPHHGDEEEQESRTTLSQGGEMM
ncbi:hypothetical protein QYE76_027060 [Lolium multiflorum]|uniref:Gag-pol polyprotein n=1 Tax=Lolium multiflorum TaxID=4521 RepID=A0AAD8VEP7_LOLMU|nr:hypothetical protein QYE76_027060 [Lolium multiflorum]